MLRWILAVALGIAVLVGAVVYWAPSLLLHYPELIAIIAGIRDPIGPNRPVVWQAGPDTPTAAPSERPPNVVVILVDDMGWNDLSWNGGGVADGSVPTPNINSLARDGVEFTMGYAGNATCAPSRAAILTGRYPQRFGFESTPAPPALGNFAATMRNANLAPGEPPAVFRADLIDQVPAMNDQGVPPSEITLAELLHENGYRTAMLGKWHLGGTERMRPMEQGFDEFLGFLSGAQLFGDPDDPEIISSRQLFDPIDLFLWKLLPFAVTKDGGPRFEPDEYMTDYLSSEAVKVIEANRNRPFFLYLAYNAPHTPLQATKADYDALSHIEDHATRVYAGMIRALDRGIGRVLDALERNGLEENTLVIFSSDNGGANYIGLPDVNKPFRGWKMTLFEGGLHSPFFVKWPAVLPAGKKLDTPIAHIDVFTTVAAAAGAEIPADRKIDGVNLLPFATGEKSGDAHEALFWRSGDYSLILAGGWKLQVSGREDKRWLFHLADDPTEQRNLIDTEPEQAAELERRLDAHNRELGLRPWPVLIEAPIAIDRTLAEPYTPGEEYVYWPN